jgi:serine/threonine protein kinase
VAERAHTPQPAADPFAVEKLLDRLRAEQERRWRRRERVPVEHFLEKHPTLHDDPRTFALVYGEYLLRERLGERVSLREFQRRFPRFARELKLQVEAHRIFASLDPARKLATGRVQITGPLESAFPDVPGYQIRGELGRGPTGVVYLARQHARNRFVALKIAHGAAGEVALSGRGGAPLRHAHIVEVHESGTHEGRPFTALEYLDGGSLDQSWRGPQNPAAVAALVETLARALDHPHRAGIVHGNLKPTNVLLSATGEQATSESDPSTGQTPWGWPKISDFGVGGSGAPEYTAPERVDGDTALTPSADVYALGAIFYEGLTGRPPFNAWEVREARRQVVEDEPVPPRRLQPVVPPDLETICLKCLEKQPDLRYASAGALAEDLRRFQAGEAIEPHPRRQRLPAWKWFRRTALAAGVAACLAAALALVGAAFGVWR